MALDPNIALSYRSPKIKSQAQREEEQLRLSVLRGQADQAGSQQAMREELATLGDLSDPERVASVVQKYDPFKAQEIRASGQKTRQENETNKRKQYMEGLEFASSRAQLLSDKYDELIANGVDDATARAQIQPLYAQTAAQVKQLFPEMQIGDQFDPTQVKGFAMQGSKALDWFKSKMPEYGAPVDTSEGLVMFDQFGNRKNTGLTKRESKPSSVQEYEYGQENPGFNEFNLKTKSAGGVNIVNNPNAIPLGTAGNNKVDEELLKNTASLSRMINIQSSFRPEFTQYGTKAKMAALSVKSKLGQLAPEEQQAMEQFYEWKSNAIANVNATIKDITGAALSEAEAVRIRQQLPDPGDGIFGGDDYVGFQAKLNVATKQLKNAIARGAYIKRNGGNMSIEDIPLSSMPKLMNDRAAEIERELVKVNPQLAQDKKALISNVRNKLAAEFGLVGE